MMPLVLCLVYFSSSFQFVVQLQYYQVIFSWEKGIIVGGGGHFGWLEVQQCIFISTLALIFSFFLINQPTLSFLSSFILGIWVWFSLDFFWWLGLLVLQGPGTFTMYCIPHSRLIEFNINDAKGVYDSNFVKVSFIIKLTGLCCAPMEDCCNIMQATW